MTYVPLLVCSVYIRGCQIEDTVPQSFPNLIIFFKFDGQTGSTRIFACLLFKEPVGIVNLYYCGHCGLDNRLFETP